MLLFPSKIPPEDVSFFFVIQLCAVYSESALVSSRHVPKQSGKKHSLGHFRRLSCFGLDAGGSFGCMSTCPIFISPWMTASLYLYRNYAFASNAILLNLNTSSEFCIHLELHRKGTQPLLSTSPFPQIGCFADRHCQLKQTNPEKQFERPNNFHFPAFRCRCQGLWLVWTCWFQLPCIGPRQALCGAVPWMLVPRPTFSHSYEKDLGISTLYILGK
jgi:hypothetical protein